ncbi:hypothetical protein BFJ71_g16622 [Fusarium oxysporum]|nr:hypothetical protein BFJ71_g16622 [Fusarium oxysporum]
MFIAMSLVGSLLLSAVAAHPHTPPTPAELQRRSSLARQCSPAVGELRRSVFERRLDKRAEAGDYVQIKVAPPHYPDIQNESVVLAPESYLGPYDWPANQMLRQDISGRQPGVPLLLDVGLMDMNTCEPLSDALISFWHCNATGYYSSFTGMSPNYHFNNNLKMHNISDYELGTSLPTSDIHTDEATFLRGLWPTNKNGVAEIQTIFPGFYVDRAIHIHVQVYTDWVLHKNGTIMSGTIAHTGQVYFEEDLTREVMKLWPYSTHLEVDRTTNVEDLVFRTNDTLNGNNPVVNTVPQDGQNVANGLYGYITMGIDSEAVQPP